MTLNSSLSLTDISLIYLKATFITRGVFAKLKSIMYLLVLATVLTSCATVYEMNKVGLDMTKTEVIKKIGKPYSASAQGHCVYLMRNLYRLMPIASMGAILGILSD
jgi:hypothetical protein